MKETYNITEYDLHHSVNDQVDLVPNYYEKYFDIGPLDKSLKLNFKGVFTNLQNDWTKIIDILKLKSVPLIHENKGNYQPVHLHNDVIEIINNSFKRDLNFYNGN